jgi:FO synthase
MQTEDGVTTATPETLRPLWAIVPAKPLAEAKSRLARCLGDARPAFARALLLQTLQVLRTSGAFSGILVVTPDELAGADARAAGAEVATDAGVSLNAACTLGLNTVRELGAALAMIVPADLALLRASDVHALIAAYRADRDRPGLVRCKNGTGTNIVVCDLRGGFMPRFGRDSFAHHAAGDHQELRNARAAFDVDDEADFYQLAALCGKLDPTDPVAAFMARLAQPGGDALCDAGAPALARCAAPLRDHGHGTIVTYSRKVFLPLTQLCRDTCHYCTFAKSPRGVEQPFMTLEQAVTTAMRGAELGCKEALFTLGERPEARYSVARDWLDTHGFASTLHYVAHVAACVRDRTGLLPHINAGCMSPAEMAMLRPVCASMGLMLESAAERLCEKGGPHYGSPDKHPAVRLQTIEEAGRQCIPFTSGLLIGIGETRRERIDALLALRALHQRYGHIQEIIIQNFVPKPGTRMANAPAPHEDELIWTIAAARILFGPAMSIQAPPNLSPVALPRLIEAGINDWGGVSPLTPDFVNPEAPWPEIESLAHATAAGGKILAQRLTIYPAYLQAPEIWLDPAMRRPALELSDAAGRGRENRWRAGRSTDLPDGFAPSHARVARSPVTSIVDEIMAFSADHLGIDAIAALFDARGSDFHHVCEAADTLRAVANGNVATYVINRNINYTNISKGTRKHEGAEPAYLLDTPEIVRRVGEARAKGASEVCLQGGIHPSFTGETYLEILRAIKRVDPAMHVHAFSPLEVWHGATTLRMTLADYLRLLRQEGLGSLPGTAAEILHDPVRTILCPDKLTTGQWLEVIETAHEAGLRTTATIMFGHVDTYRDWAIHLLAVRDLQLRTGGFTEFVPLPFVAHEAPLYKRGQARPGPTAREAVLMHAVSRLVLAPHVPNIQASWVKLGAAGMRAALRAGANDLGGTLMNESITRAAGATHGQEMTVGAMQALAADLGRTLSRRTTLFAAADTLAPLPC